MAAFEDRSSPDLDQFKGGKWTDWLTAIQSSDQGTSSQSENSSKRDVEVARLRRQDVGLFGYRPATDKFYLAVCEHCGHLVKPQSLNIHYERNHKSKRITRLPPSGITRSLHGKHAMDRSNHRIMSPPHSTRHMTSSRISSGRSSSHERSIDNSKSEPKLEKVPLDRDKRYSDPARNHRADKSSTKLIPPQPGKLRNTSSRGDNNSHTHHYPSSKKASHKPGGTIQLDDIPESRVVKSSPHHVPDTSTKHHHRTHKTSLSGTKSHESETSEHRKNDKSESHGAKSRRNHDHHRYHQTNRRISDSDPLSPDKLINIQSGEQRNPVSGPVVVMEKTSAPPSSVNKVGHSQKRARPPSGGSETSTSPPRPKVPALHNPVSGKGPTVPKSSGNLPNTAVSTKVKKKAKILPLKDREYDPNKHCGVWVRDDHSHCRRSLTCKVHPLSAKRAVTGRRKQYDELVQEHGREKQRLKEKSGAAVNSMISPTLQSIKSPPAPSPVEFAIPSPAAKVTTPLSPPIISGIVPTTSQPPTSPSVSKSKSSVNLFPRLFAAWHVDCWDNDEAADDSSGKFQNLHFIQRHPQPLSVSSFEARRSGTCQVSYSRKLERQLEAISSNFQKFGNGRPQKTQKPFSFTPISTATYCSGSSIGVSPLTMQCLNQVPQRTTKTTNPTLLSQGVNGAPQNSTFLGNRACTPQTIQPKPIKTSRNNVTRKLSNLAPPDGPSSIKQVLLSDSTSRNRSKSEQVVNLSVKRTLSNNSDTGMASDQTATSHILNDVSRDVMQSPIQGSCTFVRGTNIANVQSVQQNLKMSDLNHTMVRQKVKKGAIGKFSNMQTQSDAVLSEHVEGSPVTMQLPNGVNSLPGNVLLKPGSQSVTLSGNIGALTVTSDESNFAGNQISKTRKNMNSNNNFIVQGNSISSGHAPSVKTKHYPQQDLTNYVVTQPSQSLGGGSIENFLIQNDAFLTNAQNFDNSQITVNLNQSQLTMQNPTGFQDTIPSDQTHNPTPGGDDIARLLFNST